VTTRFVIQCDVCGEITSEHYHRNARVARSLARLSGWRYRYRTFDPHKPPHWYDVCPEHMFHHDWQTPERIPKAVRIAKQPPKPGRFPEVEVCLDEDGPYRQYIIVSKALRGFATRSQIEALRREWFAPGADVEAVAKRWVTVRPEQEEGKDG
jgi:hypothetical protein